MNSNRLYRAFGMVCVIMGGIAFGFFEYVILEPSGTVTDNDSTITHRFWIGGDDVEFDIRVGDFEGLGSSVSRTMAFPAVAYKFITPDNPTMIRLYDALNERMVGMDDKERANFLMAFVESNIEYCEDIDSHGKSEWFQYPIETILLGEGDCEDRAVLLHTLYIMGGLDSVLIKSKNHVSVGVKLDGTDNDSRYVERPLSSTRYYMADPTQEGDIGEDYVDSVWFAFKGYYSVLATEFALAMLLIMAFGLLMLKGE